ncbi:CPBP family intramembrane metalloprotease [Pseudoduganella sp. FT26W]|uniref:CPBP family intramembrane metalloprotease n=1 Tax=Duganella aquatilis TaxID=2666082 RepID=A0A844DCT6_9BURK|nr:CPBP family intramembrane glutamic endopeptidase [Duganella aquatilis]MRW85234.1 CPBP family intramembrane metalloprotease [Duganella aquatilis]
MSIAQPQVVSSVPSFRARLFAHPVTRIIIGMCAVVLPIILTLAVIDKLVPKELRFGWQFLLAGGLGIFSYRHFVRRTERRGLAELAPSGAVRETFTGVALGVALGLAVAGVLAAAGAFAISGSNDAAIMLKTLPEQMMVAVFEELLFRAVLFRIVEQRWGTRVALVVSCVVFALAHVPNDQASALGILITGVASLTLCAAYLQTRRLWLPIGLHFGWNYLYDSLFAVPVSGHTARGWLQVTMTGPDWLTGGAYGVEASVITLLLWGATAILLLRRAVKR